jgi:hypothetical protein
MDKETLSEGTGQEATTRQFELAKLDYSRLGVQEQALMDRRPEVWTKFFAILGIPSGYAGVVGIHGAVYLLALIPFFLTCVSLEIKHDEKVLRYDVRKQMKLLAAQWGFSNHDSKFALDSSHQKSRWWHGYYRYGKATAFLAAEMCASVVVSWQTGSFLGIVLGVMNILFVVVTVWCMLG